MNNINALRDGDNDAGFYAAVCATDPAGVFRGAALYRSIDAGATYARLSTLTAESTMGYTTNALANFLSGNIVDELSTINVAPLHGTLSSTTLTGLLAGVNMAIVGDEVIGFRDATLEDDGSYTLTGLLRGVRGTEYAMAGHAIGDRFILVNSSTMVRVPQTNADIGIERLWKMVAVGRTVASATPRAFTNSGAGLKPYAPSHLGGGRNADDDVILTWVRRNRIDGSWRDSVDVPMSETTEAYEVDIYDDSDYTTVLRTISVTAQTATYTAAQQTTDFGSAQATVYFMVAQISSVVGRGHAASGSV